MLNLLVIQQLEILYLGGNYVRVVCVRKCEEKSRCVQIKGVSRLDLVIDSRLVSHQRGTRVKYAGN